jgi:hypothetical protein
MNEYFNQINTNLGLKEIHLSLLIKKLVLKQPNELINLEKDIKLVEYLLSQRSIFYLYDNFILINDTRHKSYNKEQNKFDFEFVEPFKDYYQSDQVINHIIYLFCRYIEYKPIGIPEHLKKIIIDLVSNNNTTKKSLIKKQHKNKITKMDFRNMKNNGRNRTKQWIVKR